MRQAVWGVAFLLFCTAEAFSQSPVISVSPSSLAFAAYHAGALPASQKLHITNTGGGSLNWSAFRARNSGWLSLVPTSGTAPESVTVSITTTGLAPNTYVDTLIIYSASASPTTVYVPVSYTISAPPQPAVISLSPSALTFTAYHAGPLPASQKLYITNAGGGSLNWSAFRARNSGWLNLVPTGGTAPDSITVSITTTGLTPNTYYDTIVVSSSDANNSPQSVPVSYTISTAPTPAVIALSPTSFTFNAYQSGSLPASQKLYITNAGGGSLNWSAFRARNSGWLSVVPTSGTAPESVTVSITTSGLTPNTYYDTIVVSSSDAGNSPQRVPVAYTISVAPTPAVISLSPSVLAFTAYHTGPLPASQKLYITNTGGGSLNWSAFRARNSGWLSLVPTSGTAPESVTVSITTTGLTPSTYYDTIVVYSADAGNSPQTVPVIFTELENVPTDVEDGSANRPRAFALFQNYPNPFNPATKIDFTLPRTGHATLEIFNVVGQRIRVLVDGELSAGLHSVVWDGREASGQPVGSGVYFYRLKSENFSDIKRMVFLK